MKLPCSSPQPRPTRPVHSWDASTSCFPGERILPETWRVERGEKNLFMRDEMKHVFVDKR